MSWFEKAKLLAAQTVFVLEQVAQETADARWKTCWQCDRMDREARKCRECGCLLQAKIWAKTSRSPARMMGEITHCPLGRWDDKDIANHYRREDGREPLE